MSNSTKKKGRRHRTVNRTPRPVGTVTAPRAGTTAPVTLPGQKTEPDLDRVLRNLGYGRLRVPAPAAPAVPTGPVTPAAPAAPTVAAAPVAPARSAERRPAPGPAAELNKNARLTLESLERAADALTLEQVCETVGWTPRTVTRHLRTLADVGLAEQSGDGQWSATERHPVS
ncbi:helix-turn-helix domain-containing protein [Streptomyces sp. HUAS MG91]|uniref:Helix-turn-helix domain-containing protein n=1 Tax=Streptomyces tabacisoli TaxID=3156398 RepID=A0AAU8J3U7_9ACTN